MSNLSMTDSELLKYALENGILDKEYIQDKIEMQKRDEILAKHPCKIWLGSDGKWHTYLPDEIKKRVPRKRNTEREIQDVIVEYWREKENNPTVKELYLEWLNGKVRREEIVLSTRDRYNRQYNESMTDFGKRKIKTVDEYDIETFLLDAIHEHQLTSKGYSNLRTLIYGIFRLAKKKKLVSYSITETIQDMEISEKSFRKNVKTDEELVFMENEVPVVTDYLEENKDIINLGLLLIFKSGVRIGELAALKKADITGNVINISRTEVSYKANDDSMVYEVRDFPKTEAGIREVIIPDKYLWIIKEIRKINPFGEFLFEINGKRIRTYVFRNRLYTVCRKTGAVKKSPHKIRKTYGSILIDGGAADSLIISQMGHTDITTTKNYYYRNRKGQSQKVEAINSVSGL